MKPELERRAAADLGWEDVLGAFAARARSEEVVERFRARRPAPSLAALEPWLRLLGEALDLSRLGVRLPVRALRSIAGTVEAACKGAPVTGAELLAVRESLAAAEALGSFARGLGEPHAELARHLHYPEALAPLTAALGRSLEPDGTLADAASPELARARARARAALAAVEQRLDELVAAWGNSLRDRYWTSRDGRWALPVRSDALRDVDGVVLGASASGGTLYVEPREITRLGNALALARAEVERVEQRLLAELGAQVANLASEVLNAHEAALLADELTACVEVAERWGATLLSPTPGAGLELRALRHPWLVEREVAVVPNDVSLAPGRCLVLSGPNAGGKTVTLEAVGLAALLAASGLPVPAEQGSRLGWYAVTTDIGDHQSLALSLSSFSAHVAHLSVVLAEAGPESLVLLDEVASGTDPEEGALLAQAVLEALLDRGATVLVTTHYERLKELAASDARFAIASVGFELHTFQPTFRLLNGVPGPSTALAVAARFGIPREVVERARSLAPEAARQRERAVLELRAAAERLNLARAEAERERDRQRALTAALDQERDAAARATQQEIAREAQELMGRVRLARARLHAAEQRLREAPTRALLDAVEREVDRAAHEVALGSPVDRKLRGVSRSTAPPAAAQAPARLSPGTRVAVPSMGLSGEVLEVMGGQRVRIAAGSLKLVVALDALTVERGARQAPRGHRVGAARRETGGEAQLRAPLLRTTENVLDLRGQRVEAARDAVDAFLDRLLRRGEPAAFLLHGHGTGVLKAALREHLALAGLRARPADPEQGGDAYTVVELER